ncbi:hypothetical protein SASPL_120431 [Salvia splendens]|uniref:FRIGIDA-like protein n=1 Tax=Salvia splendens TaxID=180675 RepID=A0A8X8XPP3_SALSN|nr:hypothetical protein SASPL_120431 [Salvia splendens]
MIATVTPPPAMAEATTYAVPALENLSPQANMLSDAPPHSPNLKNLLPPFLNSITQLKDFSDAMSGFLQCYDDLHSHLQSIKAATLALLPPEYPPISHSPPQRPEALANTTVEKQQDDKIPSKSELEGFCKAMCSRGVRKYLVSHLSNLPMLQEQVPKALRLAPNPWKLVLECLGKFFLQGSKAFARDSPMIPAREASILVLECFLLMRGLDVSSETDCGILDIDKAVEEEANVAALAWRKRLVIEGGLAKANQIDARGLLLFVACFGVPAMFQVEDMRDLVIAGNAKEIVSVLQKSHMLMSKISGELALYVRHVHPCGVIIVHPLPLDEDLAVVLTFPISLCRGVPYGPFEQRHMEHEVYACRFGQLEAISCCPDVGLYSKRPEETRRHLPVAGGEQSGLPEPGYPWRVGRDDDPPFVEQGAVQQLVVPGGWLARLQGRSDASERGIPAVTGPRLRSLGPCLPRLFPYSSRLLPHSSLLAKPPPDFLGVLELTEMVEEMMKKKMEVDAVDIVYTFGLEERFNPHTILISFLREAKKTWKMSKKGSQGSPATLNEANKKQLDILKSIRRCLERHNIDAAKLLPGWQINEKIVILQKNITDFDRKLVVDKASQKRKSSETETSTRPKFQDAKRVRHVNHGAQQQKATVHVDSRRSLSGNGQYRVNSYAAPAVIYGGPGAGLVPEGMISSGVGATSHGGMLPTYALQEPVLVDAAGQLINRVTHPYSWQRESSINERYASQPPPIGLTSLYRASSSVEGLPGNTLSSVSHGIQGSTSDLYQYRAPSSVEGLPGNTTSSVGYGIRGSTSDLYHFADSIAEGELYPSNDPRSGTAGSSVVPPHLSSYLYQA